MITVYKYAIEPQSKQIKETGVTIVTGKTKPVVLPVGAEIIDIRTQSNEPYFWALVDTSQTATETRQFQIVPTGRAIENADFMVYRGSFHIDNGALVFHLFEEIQTIDNPFGVGKLSS